MGVDKAALLEAIQVALAEELARLRASAEATRKGAIHEESRAENDKDTRGLEASYLARGQAKRVTETEEVATALRFMAVRTFGLDDAIDISALVQVESETGADAEWFFVVPVGGGTKVSVGGTPVQLITPATALGRRLVGAYVGDEFELRIGRVARSYVIVAVT